MTDQAREQFDNLTRQPKLAGLRPRRKADPLSTATFVGIVLFVLVVIGGVAAGIVLHSWEVAGVSLLASLGVLVVTAANAARNPR